MLATCLRLARSTNEQGRRLSAVGTCPWRHGARWNVYQPAGCTEVDVWQACRGHWLSTLLSLIHLLSCALRIQGRKQPRCGGPCLTSIGVRQAPLTPATLVCSQLAHLSRRPLHDQVQALRCVSCPL